MRHLRCEGVYQRLVKEFSKDWWAYVAAAKFLEEVPGLAVIQEGELVRRLDWSGSTHHAAKRDSVERIRLLMKAQELALPEYRNGSVSGDDLAEIFLELSSLFQRREGDGQLTDLEVVPELELISQRWLPKSWSGKIKQFVMPLVPTSFEESRTDDERALWCLEQAGKFAKERKVEVKYEKADFWADTLGVHLVAYQGFIYVEGTESEFDVGAPGEFELHTLKDSETLVVGKDGPERITLPEHCRYLSMLHEVIEDPSASAELRWRAASDLIEWLYPNRRQFEKAAELAKRMDQKRGKGSEEDQQEEEYFNEEIPGPEMEVGGERFFVKGQEPELTIYSRMMEKANLEIWKLDPEKLSELNTYGNHGSVALELREDFLGNTNYDGEDIREEHAWFEKIFDLERRWEIPLRMKPLRLQSATVVKVPFSEPGTYAVVETTESGRSVYPFRIYDLVLMDRAFWGGALKTGRDGRLKVAFDLPENLTTWRLQSWAFGKGRAFGGAQLELPVSKELQVRPMLPRAGVVGDELVIGAIVQNLSEIEDDFILTLEVDGIEVKDAGAREVFLKAGAEGIAQWRVVMKEAGASLVRVKVLGRESRLSDGFEQRVPVAAKEIQRTVSGKVRVEAGAEKVVLKSPGDPGMEGRVVTVRAEANPAVSALLVLPDLARYPYGCVEQTLSRFLPLMIASKAAGDLGLEWSEMVRIFKKWDHSLGWVNGRQATELGEVELELSGEKVADMISVGIHRLDELQRNDGSWGWFSAKDEEARVDMTSLALRGLLMADAKGRDGRQLYAIERGVRWLEKWSELEISEKTEVRTLAEAAFVAWVLREAESKKVDELITKLSNVRVKLPTTSKIHLALAMEKSPGLEVVVGEIREEMKRVVQPGYRSWWNAEVEKRAYYLKFLVEIGADATELNTEVERLLESRTDGVRWRHTRESALCVEAIIEAMLAQGRDFSNEEEEHRVTIFGPGGEREIVLSKANLWTESIELPLGDDWKKSLSIRAKNAGAEGVRVAASTSHPTSDTEFMHASEDGLKLERNYYRLSQGGGRTLISEDEQLKVGEVIQVVLVVSTDVPREFLHVRDAIPAGLEQLNQLSGYRSGAFQQSRTGEAHFFLNSLDEGERSLSYTVNVVTEGGSLALPAQVECMYAPDFRGQSGSRWIEVRR